MTLLVTFLCGWILGILICKYCFEVQESQQIKALKEEHAAEKEGIRADITDNLAKIRSGIIQAVSAYSDTVKVIQEKLPIPSSENPSKYLELKVEDNNKNLP